MPATGLSGDDRERLLHPLRKGTGPRGDPAFHTAVRNGGDGGRRQRGSAPFFLCAPTAGIPPRAGPGEHAALLGLGFVTVQPPPAVSPESAVMAEPVVPDTSASAQPRLPRRPGQSDAAQPPAGGCCPQCGRPYSFVPTLQPGDSSPGSTRSRAASPYGGLGWIYLAKDTTLGRWVVLKGLLNTGRRGGRRRRGGRAAVPRRRQAPQHRRHLQLRQARRRRLHRHGVRRRQDAQGPAQGARPAAACRGHRLHPPHPRRVRLPARSGLVYCDFKPDNFMLEGDRPT